MQPEHVSLVLFFSFFIVKVSTMYLFKQYSSFGGEGSLTSSGEEMFSQSPFVAPGV